jgi:hypothetical protein
VLSKWWGWGDEGKVYHLPDPGGVLNPGKLVPQPLEVASHKTIAAEDGHA